MVGGGNDCIPSPPADMGRHSLYFMVVFCIFREHLITFGTYYAPITCCISKIGYSLDISLFSNLSDVFCLQS